MSVGNGAAAIGALGWDTVCGNLGRIIVIIVILAPVSKRPIQSLYFNLRQCYVIAQHPASSKEQQININRADSACLNCLYQEPVTVSP